MLQPIKMSDGGLGTHLRDSLVSDDGCEETMIRSDTKIPALKIPQTFTLTIPPYKFMFYVIAMFLDALLKKPLTNTFLHNPEMFSLRGLIIIYAV